MSWGNSQLNKSLQGRASAVIMPRCAFCFIGDLRKWNNAEILRAWSVEAGFEQFCEKIVNRLDDLGPTEAGLGRCPFLIYILKNSHHARAISTYLLALVKR